MNHPSDAPTCTAGRIVSMERGERARSMHVLGHDVALTVLLPRIVDRQDVRMLQHPDQVCFGKEHLARDSRPLLVAARLDVVDLDCDVTPVVGVVRQIHDARTAAADFLDDHVLADFLGDPAR